ncbi:MAG: phage/plasmid primase, P4 family [Planctomycetota bacterium]|nr:phage/plasmid primase, P4 family [Planctomycetota bacterium]
MILQTTPTGIKEADLEPVPFDTADATAAESVPMKPNGNPTQAGSILGLRAHHLRELREGSGLSEETIMANGIYSEDSHAKLAITLNQKSWPRKQGAGLVIPFFDENGKEIMSRVKPDNPPTRKGKRCKYLSPTGSTVRVYFPSAVRPVLQKPESILLFTEGEKKSLKATQEGFPTIGLTGVDCWHGKKSSALLPDLDRINWTGRCVFIAFDSDAAENPNVADNEVLLAAALTKRGAVVKVVRIPPGLVGADGKPTKVGLDDFLVANGANELWKLLDVADEPEPPEAGSLLVDAKELDTARAGEDFLAAYVLHDVSRLRFWRGAFHLWLQGAYREVQPSEVRARVIRHLNKTYSRLQGRIVSDVIDQVRAQAILGFSTEPPSWVCEPPTFADRTEYWPEDSVLVARNGLVHLPSLVQGRDHYLEPTPRFFATGALDYDFDATAPRPDGWLDFLGRLWPDDPQSVEALQEWFGYTLTPDTRQQKMLVIVGPKRSGKGTIARVQRRLIGPANVAGPTLASLSTNFGLWPLLGKMLAVISDARLSGRTDQSIVVERLLSISGEDALTVDRKCMEPITTKLATRIMMLTNELPRLSDASSALASRIILLRLSESFYGREDHGLTEKLLAELPGIMLWAVEGWRRLQERGYFVQPDSAMDLLSELQDLSSPISAFIRDRCVVGPEHLASVDDLFAAWKSWCDTNGRKEAGTTQTLGQNLLAALPKIRKVRPRVDGERYRGYEGIGVRTYG